MAHRTILHLDLDAFFCAVEEQRDPALAGKPFAVGGPPEQRGVVASCSYAARQFGVHSALPMGQALRLCPGLLIVPPHFDLYHQASAEVMTRLRAITPLVEQVSIDEAFLDCTDLSEPGESIARRLQADIRADLGLPCSLGIASNKLVAKIATDYGKKSARAAALQDPAARAGPPNAIQVVPAGQEAAFLAPLPAEALWGVGPKTAARLAEIGLHTIGDIAKWPSEDLVERFGKNGRELARHANGLDDRPVETSAEIKSISQEVTFSRDRSDRSGLLMTLSELSAGVSQRLQAENLTGVTVRLKLRWSDFSTLSRQHTLSEPTDQADQIFAVASRLFASVWRPGRPVRLLGIGVSGFRPRSRQRTLWDLPEPIDPPSSLPHRS